MLFVVRFIQAVNDPLIPAVLLGVGMVYVLIARIREIRSDEEDELSDY